MPTVLACGLAVLDVVQDVDHVPAADEKLVATDLHVAAGGPAANAAVTAAALGMTARLVTRVGATPLGTLVRADLAAHHVDVVDLAGPGDAPGVSTVLVTASTGQRAVVSVNAARATGAGTEPDWPTLVSDADVLLVDGHHLDLALGAAGAARASGVPVLLDGGSWKPGLEALLALVDVAVVSADLRIPADVAADSSDLLATLLRLGPAVAARSRGAGLIEVLDAAGYREVPVGAVDVVDTLGAGDALHGALAAWLAAAGGRTGPDAALRWAGEVASASCTGRGARGWLEDADRLARLRAGLPGAED
ncbi:PfkB family carbohydrate kinase [Actinotalea sp. M2MS4P-6]|uniref:PfkB family carbohydrate kinase n=1 Tax=Actinotalea sp. M2MS4P-6 TaxID=2983762 RepID=UPI0021E3C2AE|nr:PfkB family carbohydrate kinase [Actinotalea sp. M2MS4P-6]MCV2394925.1 PfkB family carbohydrate kinase [Actinotalea sp. M2MS4P-6]